MSQLNISSLASVKGRKKKNYCGIIHGSFQACIVNELANNLHFVSYQI